MRTSAVRTAASALPLAGRTALVTGGSRGVGAGVALELGRRGARVAVTYQSRGADADVVVKALRKAGSDAVAVPFDAADPATARSLADTVRDQLGEVDLLVSNGGVASRGRPLVSTGMDEFGRLMTIHAFGPIALIQALLPGMRTKERSDVIVVSSAITDTTPPGTAPYVMAKAAMETACRVLAYEERKHGVHVNVVAPGLVATDMGQRLVAATGGEGIDATATASPFGRVCTPLDIGRLIAFLASDDAGYLSGTRTVIDGGGTAPTIY